MSLRAEIVAAAREMHRLGLVAGCAGNVSAREGDRIHITPAGLPYDATTEARPGDPRPRRGGRRGGARAVE